MSDHEEFVAGFRDFALDGLAYVEAQARDDDPAAAVILGHAGAEALLPAVAAVAEQCAITGATFDSGVSENSSPRELLAARDEVLRRVRRDYERADRILRGDS